MHARRLRSKAMAILLLGCIGLAAVSCGGGGGGGGDGSPTFPAFTPADPDVSMTMNQDNAVQAAGLALFGHTVSDLTGGGSVLPMSQGTSQPSETALSATLRAILVQIETELPRDAYEPTGASSGGEACPFGGSMHITMQWDGTDQVYDYCDILNVRGTMSLNNCKMDNDSSMNGSVSFEFQGAFCQPSQIHFTLSNYAFTEPNLVFRSPYLRLVATDLADWSGQLPYGWFNSATCVLNGQASGTLEGESLAAAFIDYTEVVQALNSYQVNISFSGRITGPCLDGWADISTVTPILIDDLERCPLDGRITISGDGAPMDVVFHEDGSVEVGSVVYANCEDIEVNCPLP